MNDPRLSAALPAAGFAALVAAATVFASGETPPAPARSQWVYPGADGRLVYKATERGDRILDFSHAGYRGGGVALPTVPVKKTVKPSGGEDDTPAIQAAIDAVSALPLENGVRGAVLLEPGVYALRGTLRIVASGVVLRGSGSGASGGARSTLKLAGTPHNAITVRAADEGAAAEDGAATTLADAYVPSGARSFRVKDARGFAPGDAVVLRRPVTAAWVKFMQMDDLTRDGKPQTWIKLGSATTTERRVTAVRGDTLTVDVPLSDSFDARYLDPPGTAVVKVRPPARVSEAGVENLHIESPAQPIPHSQPHYTALRVHSEDCWVRDVVADETMNSVAVGGRRVTLERVTVRRKADHVGSSRPAEFAPNGGQVLLDRCRVEADNVWFVASGAGQAGPVVVLNGVFVGSGRAESHQRWSTGILYDNCQAPGGGIELRNRGAMGSGHGWSMGWGVVWNCVAKDYLIQNPPGAVNWLIGSVGPNKAAARPFGKEPLLPGGVVDAPGTPVAPRSLYLAQLAERLGPAAVRNIGYPAAGAAPPPR